MSSPHHVPVSFEEPSSGGDRQRTFWDLDCGGLSVCLSVCLPFFFFSLSLPTYVTASIRHDWGGPLSSGRHMTICFRSFARNLSYVRL